MKVFLALCFFAFILGCNDKPASESSTGEFFYEIASLSTPSDFPVREPSLSADSTGRLFFHLELLNQSESQISLFPADWELETADGLRSSPVGSEDSLTMVPDSIYVLDFVFEPVNSLKMYQLTGLKGDLGSQYKVSCKPNLLTIDFRLSDDRYTLYRKRWGSEDGIVIFLPQIQPDFAVKELEYLSKNINLNHDGERADHGVNVSEQEILVDGLNVNFLSYALEDSLSMTIRVTNHSPFVTSLKTFSIQLQMDSAWIEPAIIGGKDYMEIPRSQRAIIQLKFPLPEGEAPGFLLDASSFTFHTPAPVKVFYRAQIPFKQTDL